MTLSFAFSGLNFGTRSASMFRHGRTVSQPRFRKPNTKLPGYWISRSELLGFRGLHVYRNRATSRCTTRTERKNGEETCAGSGMRWQEFFFAAWGKRMVEQNFASAAMDYQDLERVRKFVSRAFFRDFPSSQGSFDRGKLSLGKALRKGPLLGIEPVFGG